MGRLYKNLIRGAGYIIDIAPKRKRRIMETIYYRPYESDLEAIRSDWERVGHIFKEVIDREIKNYASKNQT